jgi:hypothetical protein
MGATTTKNRATNKASERFIQKSPFKKLFAINPGAYPLDRQITPLLQNAKKAKKDVRQSIF